MKSFTTWEVATNFKSLQFWAPFVVVVVVGLHKGLWKGSRLLYHPFQFPWLKWIWLKQIFFFNKTRGWVLGPAVCWYCHIKTLTASVWSSEKISSVHRHSRSCLVAGISIFTKTFLLFCVWDTWEIDFFLTSKAKKLVFKWIQGRWFNIWIFMVLIADLDAIEGRLIKRNISSFKYTTGGCPEATKYSALSFVC